MTKKKKTASKYLKQNLTDLKREANIFTIRIGDYSTLLSVIDRTSGKKITNNLDVTRLLPTMT